MPYELQAKLLRVLQENYIRRVGGTKDIPIDVRIITTSNEHPEIILKQGKLRKDLYYRLNVIQIRIPPLRERREDVLMLANKFIQKYNERLNKDIASISHEAKESLLNYEYPGNVRELENIIMAAVSMSDDQVRTLDSSSFYIQREELEYNDIQEEMGNEGIDEYLEKLEKKIIENALNINNNNITKSAETLKIKRQTLQHKIKKYGINL
ncbi:MAG: sigma 54-interacting transcriptional regulator, partial [Sedimentibacter sp.]